MSGQLAGDTWDRRLNEASERQAGCPCVLGLAQITHLPTNMVPSAIGTLRQQENPWGLHVLHRHSVAGGDVAASG